MKPAIWERLDKVLRDAAHNPSRLSVVTIDKPTANQTAFEHIVKSLLEGSASELVVVIDESDSMRVLASDPKVHSCKLRFARLIAELATYMNINKLVETRVIRLGSFGRTRNQRFLDTASTEVKNVSNGNTVKAEKTAYLVRNLLTRLSTEGHMIIVSDFRSHMWRRTLSVVACAAPKVSLVHLVDEIDCDYVLSKSRQLELATMPDLTPWITPLKDSAFPPSDIHAYLTAFADENYVDLAGIVVQSESCDEFMCFFERKLADG